MELNCRTSYGKCVAQNAQLEMTGRSFKEVRKFNLIIKIIYVIFIIAANRLLKVIIKIWITNFT
jgi:hypothetical protein